MPIYEYNCQKCKNTFELRRSFNDFNKPASCPACNSSCQKVTSSFACKTGGNLQAAEKPFRAVLNQEFASPIPNVLIPPPPKLPVLLTPPE
jgi:putative FmdB family regulatory protein